MVDSHSGRRSDRSELDAVGGNSALAEAWNRAHVAAVVAGSKAGSRRYCIEQALQLEPQEQQKGQEQASLKEFNST